MSRMGRPTKLVIGRRRQRLVRVLAKKAAASDEIVKKLAEELNFGERTIRQDLGRLAADDEGEGPLPLDLAADLGRTSSNEELLKIEKRLASEAASGRVSEESATLFFEACKEIRQTLRAAKAERAQTEHFIGDAAPAKKPEATPPEDVPFDASEEAAL